MLKLILDNLGMIINVSIIGFGIEKVVLPVSGFVPDLNQIIRSFSHQFKRADGTPLLWSVLIILLVLCLIHLLLPSRITFSYILYYKNYTEDSVSGVITNNRIRSIFNFFLIS